MSTGVRRTPVRVAGAAVLAGAMLAVAACGSETDSGTTASPTPEESATASATPSPSPSESSGASPSEQATPSEEPTAAAVTAGVHYLVDTRAGIRLARELRELPGEDPLTGAVEAMIAGPQDPDYTTTWNPGTQVLGVTREGGTITVDLSEEASQANVGSEGAAMMIQQLVYTVTEAAGDRRASVRLLVEGEPAGELWGAVSWDGPVKRRPPLDVRMLVQIDTPAEGATVTSPLTVEGEANAFEATVLWTVVDDRGGKVDSGFASTSEAYKFRPYSFEVELEPGTYTVEVAESDPSGGEGGEPMADTRTITVE